MNAKPEWWSSDHWATPPDVMAALVSEFGPFDLDPCCRPETAKAPVFYTPEQDGLSREWRGRVFLNPPYSKPRPWLEKAAQEVAAGRALIVVAVLPVRTDTRWFHEVVLPKAELRFLRGRIKWIGWQGTPIPQPKDPSMLAIFRAQMDEDGDCLRCGLRFEDPRELTHQCPPGFETHMEGHEIVRDPTDAEIDQLLESIGEAPTHDRTREAVRWWLYQLTETPSERQA